MKLNLKITTLLAICMMTMPSITEAKILDLKAAAQKAGLAPHKALYDIELKNKKSGSQIVNIYGQMFYEWKPACEAWEANHRFDLTYEYADTPPMRVTSQFTTYEDFSADVMNFSSQRKRDGAVYEEIRGHAEIADGLGGKAIYNIPYDLTYALPDNTHFPIRHTVEILKTINEGKKFYSAVVFDGSDEKGPVEMNAFIGKPADKQIFDDNAQIDKSLLEAKALNVRIAAFPLSEPSSTAEYEMSLVLHKNGIISDMVIEYKDFSVRQSLKALEPVASFCENNIPSIKTP